MFRPQNETSTNLLAGVPEKMLAILGNIGEVSFNPLDYATTGDGVILDWKFQEELFWVKMIDGSGETTIQSSALGYIVCDDPRVRDILQNLDWFISLEKKIYGTLEALVKIYAK